MVPAVQIASTLMSFLTFGLAFAFYAMPKMGNTFMLIFIVCQSIITLFSLVTLPVEIDASRRALAWLNTAGITRGQEDEDAKDALKWAAYTYFVSALGSVATLLYMILKYTSRRD
jgi:Zn-dependent membrane protease YugP